MIQRLMIFTLENVKGILKITLKLIIVIGIMTHIYDKIINVFTTQTGILSNIWESSLGLAT